MGLRSLLSKHWFITLFIFLLVFGVGLRFMSSGLFHYDSVGLAQSLERNMQSGGFSSATGRVGMLVVATVVYLPFYVVGDSAEFAVRLTGILMLALSAVAIYLLAFELSRSRIGALCAALLMSVMPLFIIPSTYGKEHSTAMFFFVIACYCAVRSHRSISLGWSTLASLLMVCALATRELFIVGLPAFLWFLVLPRFRVVDGRWRLLLTDRWNASLTIFGSILLAALMLFLGRQIQGITAYSAAALSWSGSRLVMGLVDVYGNVKFIWPFFLLGLYAVWRTGRDYAVVLALLMAPVLIIPLLAGYYPRYLDIVVLGMVIVVGFGVAWLVRRWFTIGVLAMLLIILATFWLGAPFLQARHVDDQVKSFAVYLSTVTEPDAFIIGGDECGFVRYYGNRTCATLVPTEDAANQTIREIASMLRETPVYVLQRSWLYPGGVVLRDTIRDNFETELAGRHLLDNYHGGEKSIFLRNTSIIRITRLRANVSMTNTSDLLAFVQAGLS